MTTPATPGKQGTGPTWDQIRQREYPREFVDGTRLSDIQVDGLIWMIHKENIGVPGKSQPKDVRVVGPSQGGGYRNYVADEKYGPPPGQGMPHEPRGGILAFAMGMGKTLTMLSLLLIKRVENTLVVCPKSLMYEVWEAELHKHVQPDAIVHHTHYQEKRLANAALLRTKGLVITSYETLVSEYHNDADQRGPLFGLQWDRVIFDEAHRWKNHRTKVFRAVSALEAERRWAMTGTPVQNMVGELCSYLMALRVPGFQTPDEFYRKFAVPYRAVLQLAGSKAEATMGQTAETISNFMTKRLHRRIMLYEGAAPMPKGREYHTITVELEQVERNAHAALRQKICHANINPAAGMQLGRLLTGPGVRALQPAHRFLVEGASSQTAIELDSDEAIAAQAQLEVQRSYESTIERECELCSQPIPAASGDYENTPYLVDICAHAWCSDCFGDIGKPASFRAFDCASCCAAATPTMAVSARPVYPQPVLVDRNFMCDHVPAKAQAVLYFVLGRRATHPDSKVVIFAIFKKSLTIISELCGKAGISFFCLDGSLGPQARGAALDGFRSASAFAVLGSTCGAGGEGLNLQCADVVVIVDLALNPAVEQQAIARVARNGQQKKVLIVRMLAKDSVDEAIDGLLEDKAFLIATMDPNAKATSVMLTEASIKRLSR